MEAPYYYCRVFRNSCVYCGKSSDLEPDDNIIYTEYLKCRGKDRVKMNSRRKLVTKDLSVRNKTEAPVKTILSKRDNVLRQLLSCVLVKT